IQGDHFQANAKNYAKDRVAEIEGIKKATKQAIDAGFYNIDIDTSTLVDLSKATLAEQQGLNCSECAAITEFTRANQPKGVQVSLGGEIGEVGGKNSTVEELTAFMDGYQKLLPKGTVGLSKISVQTGTAHGGVVLPDGTMAQVKVDFDALQKLSELSRTRYGMGGAVQHGASTLPIELFDKFPQMGTCEIHLATEFQNMVYEHPAFPKTLKAEMYEFLVKDCAGERKAGESDSQFYYKTRKKALGPFKERLWGLPEDVRETLMGALEQKVEVLIRKLNVTGTGPKTKPFAIIGDGAIPSPSGAAGKGPEHFEGDD
ncbi:MAG: class II fructose-bisphosphate aldolase, partial [bacterium]